MRLDIRDALRRDACDVERFCDDAGLAALARRGKANLIGAVVTDRRAKDDCVNSVTVD